MILSLSPDIFFLPPLPFWGRGECRDSKPRCSMSLEMGTGSRLVSSLIVYSHKRAKASTKLTRRFAASNVNLCSSGFDLPFPPLFFFPHLKAHNARSLSRRDITSANGVKEFTESATDLRCRARLSYSQGRERGLLSERGLLGGPLTPNSAPVHPSIHDPVDGKLVGKWDVEQLAPTHRIA